jgi:hypothetical protein
MLHLLQTALNPPLSLLEAIRHWGVISWHLREAPRTRELQMDELAAKTTLVS